MSLAPVYTTVSACLVLFPAAGSMSAVTSAHVADFIGQAQALVDAKLCQLHTTPFAAPVPPLIETITADIAVYRLLSRRIFPGERMTNSEWPDRYKESLALLDEIAAGQLALADSSGQIITGRTDVIEVWSNTQGYHPTMDVGAWEEMTTDPDRLTDVKDAKL